MYICENNTIKLNVRVLIVDFYDSFTYNLKHYTEPFCKTVDVIRDDQLNLNQLSLYDKIILSPGPGLPQMTKNMFEILKLIVGVKPVLGVCLGMQGIVEYDNGRLFQKNIMHGKQEIIEVDVNSVLFHDFNKNQQVGLYHSWSVKLNDNGSLYVTAKSKSNIVMAVESKELGLFGVQFHPESILTVEGKQILNNFLNYTL